jgi:hypothetical protein
VNELLLNDRGFIPGTLAPIVVQTVTSEVEHTWTNVEQAIGDALLAGAGCSESPGDLVWALRADAISGEEIPLWETVEAKTIGFKEPLVALSSVLLDDPSPLVPPPLAWPLPQTMRLALLERVVRLVHVIDLARFMHLEIDGARVIEIRRGADGVLQEPCFMIDAGDFYAAASTRFVDEVIYGYQTIESTTHTLLSGLRNVDWEQGEDLASVKERGGPLGSIAAEMSESKIGAGRERSGEDFFSQS